jgi:hypothetical protein
MRLHFGIGAERSKKEMAGCDWGESKYNFAEFVTKVFAEK